MAILSSTLPTLVDTAKLLGPDNKIAWVANLLAQANPINHDLMWDEANDLTTHLMSVATGLPDVYWTRYNEPTPHSKARYAQIRESIGMLESVSKIDCRLADLGGQSDRRRAMEAEAFLIAMANEAASTFIYGNSETDPKEFNGLSPRFSSLSAENAQNIIDCDGNSNRTSVWLVGHGYRACYGIYPRGSTIGLTHEDHGVQLTSGSTGTIKEYVDMFSWHCGLAVHNWRHVVRAANIDAADIVENASGTALAQTFVRMVHRLPQDQGGVKYCFYVNGDVGLSLDLQRLATNSGSPFVATGGAFGTQASHGNGADAFEGSVVGSFRGIPIKRLDAITSSETAVS